MTRHVTRLLADATTMASLTAVAGCGSSADKDTGSAPAATPGTPSAASITVRPQVRATTSGPPGVPTPGSMAEPATSSGTLSKRSFPMPPQLGPGWTYTAAPFGCERRTRLPVPVHALETGMILRSGVIAGAMRHSGWSWGARWARPDYQHFSSNGG